MDAQKIAEIARRLGQEYAGTKHDARFDRSDFIDSAREDGHAKAWEKAIPLLVKLAGLARHKPECLMLIAIVGGYDDPLPSCTCGYSEALEEFNHLTNT